MKGVGSAAAMAALLAAVPTGIVGVRVSKRNNEETLI